MISYLFKNVTNSLVMRGVKGHRWLSLRTQVVKLLICGLMLSSFIITFETESTLKCDPRLTMISINGLNDVVDCSSPMSQFD